MTKQAPSPKDISAPASGSMATEILDRESSTSETPLSGSQPKSMAVTDVTREAVARRMEAWINEGRPL